MIKLTFIDTTGLKYIKATKLLKKKYFEIPTGYDKNS